MTPDAPAPTTEPQTRRRLLRRCAWAIGCAAAGGVGLSMWGERHATRVSRHTLAFPNLPPGLDGLRICQVSDLHRSPHVSEQYLAAAMDQANALTPDLTVVTGDLLSGPTIHTRSAAELVGRLRAPLGVWAVPGNHDYWSGTAEELVERVERGGAKWLINRSVRIERRDSPLWLAGVDDVWAGDADLDRALGDSPEDGFRVLLAHEPDFADQAAMRGIDLQLSGHSHGGQVRLPGFGALVTPRFGQKYPIGLRRVAQRMRVYTNVGLGVIFPPIRWNCPPEITLLTLRRGAPSPTPAPA